MTDRDEAIRALASTDWSGATVDREPAQVAWVSQGVKLRPWTSEALVAAAKAKGVRPATLARELLEHALAAPTTAVAPDEPAVVTVRVDRLRAAMDQVIQQAIVPPAAA